MATATHGNKKTQQNAVDQSMTNKQTEESDTIDDDFIPPPAEFN